MTGQAKNTAYEVSKAEELQSTNQAQSGFYENGKRHDH